MEIFLCVCLGVGLSAACGFRVFVPFLILSIAALTGHVQLAKGFAWIGTYPALITFGIATLVEILGYYIPWVDHLLDTMATPAAVVAGIIMTAAVLKNVDPFFQWTMAAIAGGGLAAVVQTGTVVTRAASTGTTGGIGNPIVATFELILSAFTSILTVFLPIVAFVLIAVLSVFLGRQLWKRFRPAQIAA
ncbi:MAG TPA: DUF4126 domain-containing protein [Candidatus Saccharimonadales bacterium]|nr:DUF4126 domain-containing protein [Candidatus Saccharimonadales bacterium]